MKTVLLASLGAIIWIALPHLIAMNSTVAIFLTVSGTSFLASCILRGFTLVRDQRNAKRLTGTL